MKNLARKSLVLAVAALPAAIFAQEAETVETEVAAEPVAAEVAPAEEAAPAAAPAAVEADTATRLNTLAKTRVKSASSKVREDMRAWKREAKIKTGVVNAKGAIYLEGTARVSVNVAKPEFVMARSAAFEQAYLNALTEYIMDKSGVTSLDLASKYFPEGSSDRYEPNPKFEDAAERIARKTQMLEEAKLDAALREQGVPATEVKAKTIVEKRQLFVENILTESVDTAVDSAAGLAVVKTFEGNDEKGDYSIGVILRGGTDTEVIAECLRDKKRPMMKRPELAEPIENLLPPLKDIVQEFGVRIVFDEEGVPALLSFGQWGSDYTGTDEEEAEDMERLAMEQAKGQANDLLTTFINSNINIVNRRTRGASRERFLEFDENGIPTSTSIKKFASKIAKTTTMTGRDTMIGRSTVFEDVIDHPTGHRVAVCVRMWSFKQYDLMQGIKDRPRASEKKVEEQKARDMNIPEQVIRSRTYDF